MTLGKARLQSRQRTRP